ncbi:MAG TPA: OmpA family protein [Candidatus Kapabacteria bacterium]
MRRIVFIFLFATVFALAGSAFGQDIPAQSIVSPFHAGLRIDYLKNYHATTSEIVADCPECGYFSNGVGGGYEFQLFGEVPFNFLRRLDLDFGLGVTQRGGSFGLTSTNELTVYDENKGQDVYEPLDLQHNFTASLIYLDLSGGLRFDPIKHFAGYCSATLDAGIPVGHSASAKQTETIISPQGYIFPATSSTTSTESNGSIQGISTLFGITGTVGYELPFGSLLTASPELSYYLPVNSVASTRPWHVSSISIGVALRWNEPPKEIPGEPNPTPQKQEPPRVARQDPNAFAPKLAAASIASEPLHIVETTVTETFPILPYIFFDSASAQLPDRFAQISAEEANRFQESELPHRSLESYYQILNVIGNRMRANPEATLTINGTTDGQEVAGGGNELGIDRSNTVRDYLKRVWRIDPTRLIQTRSEEPHNPSSTQYAEGFEENRRVELSSDNDQILKPIVHERFREESALPKTIPIALTANSSIGIRHWQLAILSHDSSVFESSGEAAPPAQLTWQPNDAQIESLAKTLTPKDSLMLHFEAEAANGAHSVQDFAFPASKTINPFELSRLSLIVFDFDQSKIGEQNERMISQFVAKSFYPASTASITGSTDNLGELAHNQTLSEARAFNVRDLILKDKPDAKITSAKGIGPSNLLYDNHLPEGRYYCRTVRVEVQTPLESILPEQK